MLWYVVKSHKEFFFAHKSRVGYDSYHTTTSPLSQFTIQFLSFMIRLKRSNMKVSWNQLRYWKVFRFLCWSVKSLAFDSFFSGKSQEVTGILLRTARSRGWSSVSNVFFRSRALCWLNNMSRKSIKTFSIHLGVSLISFLDLWAWISSYGEQQRNILQRYLWLFLLHRLYISFYRCRKSAGKSYRLDLIEIFLLVCLWFNK